MNDPIAAQPDDVEALIEQIRAFLADASKGNPHEGYRYGELLSFAAAAIAALRAERDALREDADYVLRMLDAAKCPTCDGGGTTLYGDQCEWCFSRQVACAPLNAAIDAARAKVKP